MEAMVVKRPVQRWILCVMMIHSLQQAHTAMFMLIQQRLGKWKFSGKIENTIIMTLLFQTQ